MSTLGKCGALVGLILFLAQAPVFGGGDPVICNDGLDNDGDGLVDCDDPDCAADAACLIESICDDGFDNDLDGLIDCDDPDCAADPACPESLCDDGLDNDLDGLIDCADPDCAADPACPESLCDDGLDNDLDGLIDCADPDCAADPACPETICDDGLDDDGDGLVDCDDPDCAAAAVCLPESICDDGLDDDGDGLVDCDDPDCAAAAVCLPESICDDGLDDDGDGLVDCDDPDCAAAAVCLPESICDDGLDDDGDGLVDCDDPDCAAAAVCLPESICDDGLDDDGDGLVDCDDPDCAAAAVCLPESICDDGLDDDGDGLVDCDDPDCAAAAVCLPESICDDGLDDDGDGLVDCDDPDCAAAAVCLPESICDDGLDDDGDGLVDCDDPDCAAAAVCLPESICDDGLDDDGDGLVDCDDPDCAAAAVCLPESICDDGLDDDGDGLVDCDDPDCAAAAVCLPESICDDGLDDDGDGLVDCDDPDCAAAAVCLPESICDDGLDDDGDGLVDCDDPDCAAAAVCLPESICDDGLDDDGDGLVDCDDPDCAAAAVCLPESICDDGLDDDGDGLVDCDDPDCAAAAVCLPESICDDGLDDDGDGLVDCDDPDCAAAAVCLPESICDDGLDDDGDGLVDCDDADCSIDIACQPPANDECDGAEVIPNTGFGTFTATIDSTFASTGTDPAPTISCSVAGAFFNDVWLSFTPDVSGALTVVTCDPAGFDTDVLVYSGACGALVEESCNGDAASDSECQSFHSQTPTIEAQAGTTYLIRIGGWNSSAFGVNAVDVTLGEIVAEVCDDGLDNDIDGDVDCADDDCFGDLACQNCLLQEVFPQEVSPPTLDSSFFGAGVAIDGSFALVHDTLGEAYFYMRDGTTWDELQIVPSLSGGDFNGPSQPVALEGEWAVVGAPLDDTVQVFRRVSGFWVEFPFLLPLDLESGDLFGNSVAISGNVIVIGAPGDGAGTGSVYVYRFSGVAWGLEDKLTASAPEAEAAFGSAVDVSGDTIAVGAPGPFPVIVPRGGELLIGTGSPIFIYRLVGATWVEDPLLELGSLGLGTSVSLAGEVLLVTGFDGIAFIGDLTTGVFDPLVSPPAIGQVALHNEVAVVGVLGGAAVYRFNQSLDPIAIFTPDGAGGSTVAVSGDTVLVGSPFDELATFFGIPQLVPPTLDCVRSSVLTNGIDATWLNGSSYSEIVVLLDGVVFETLPGDATEIQIPIADPSVSHEVRLRATTICGVAVAEVFCTIEFGIPFRRGDCNGGGLINISDSIFLLNVLFGGEGQTPPCYAACDVNDSGVVNISDVIFQLGVLFSGEGPTPAPGPGCGTDPTSDLLSCANSSCLAD